MKRILILGNKGMAGHMLFNYFSEKEGYEIYGAARNIEAAHNQFNLDVTDTEGLKKKIYDYNFDFIVNCIGILNKDAEDYPDKAIWFNSYFPHFLEDAAKHLNTKIIHISTDCVFSGKEGNYTENDFKDGIGFYAQSKALGEIDNDKDLTIRTSIIGPELNSNGIGLFHWFMLQNSDSTLAGYKLAYWSGITTLELAKVIDEVIKQDVTGLIEVAAPVKINKYELLLLFNEIYRNSSLKIVPNEDYKVDKSLKSIREDFDYKIRDYRILLNEQKVWMLTHPALYNRYRI